MKNTKKLGLLLISGVALALSVIGCGENNSESIDSQMLIVENQHVDCYETKLSVDVPIKGPQPLLDSIKIFLNQEVHDAFEGSLREWDREELGIGTSAISAKKVYTDDMSRLLSSYAKKYAALWDKYETTEYDLYKYDIYTNLSMIAQTDSYVTFVKEVTYCINGNHPKIEGCYTFSKKDGHRISNVIEWKELVRYVIEHRPPYGVSAVCDDDAYTSCVWYYHYNNEDGLFIYDEESLQELENCHDSVDSFCTGLMGESLWVSYDMSDPEWTYCYGIDLIDYEDIIPYLTKEAQELVKSRGDVSQYKREAWHMGSCIGKVKNNHGKTILLMEREPFWNQFYFVNLRWSDEWKPGFYRPCSLTAYTVEDGEYIPQEIFSLDERLSSRVESYFISKCNFYDIWDEEQPFSFDESNNKISVIARDYRGKIVNCHFKFDGQHFVMAGMPEVIDRDQ